MSRSETKKFVPGVVVEAGPLGPPPCYTCGSAAFWRGRFNTAWVCATCHPPASPGLVGEWWDPLGKSPDRAAVVLPDPSGAQSS